MCSTHALISSNQIAGSERTHVAVFPQAKEHEDSFLDTVLQTKGDFSQHFLILSASDDVTYGMYEN